MEFGDLKNKILEYNKEANFKLIEKAYNFAKKAHAGQKRDDGSDYFSHPVWVAEFLTEMKADENTLISALLHDLVEDKKATLKKIEEEFNKEIASIVEGLTKIQWGYFSSEKEFKGENLRKILLATSKDPRVMIIKLVDRLHNVQNLENIGDVEKAKRIAKATMEIFVPIAYKLGMNKIKKRMQSACFKILHPKTFSHLNKIVEEKVEKLHPLIEKIMQETQEKLKKKEIPFKIFWRSKDVYSTYQKMQKYDCPIEEVYDIIAFRILTNTISNCYMIQEILLKIGKQFTKFGNLDYIEHPKPNGYRAIHLLIEVDKQILEFQIRTKQMDQEAEFGATQWMYKEKIKDKKLDKKMVWLKEILQWQERSQNAKEFLQKAKIDLFHKEIIVFTPKGDAFHLPENSTPVDFAYAVHSNLGDVCDKAKVNGKLKHLNYTLDPGDKVEIIIKKNKKPSREWLKFVKTGKAKTKIRKALGLQLDQKHQERKSNFSLHDLSKFLDSKKKNIKISKCCNPDTHDKIVAFYTKDKKITVHKANCINIHTLDEKNKIELDWNKKEPTKIEINLLVEDRAGIISDLLEVLYNHKIKIISLNTLLNKKDKINVIIETEFSKDLNHPALSKDINKIKGAIKLESIKTGV